MASQYHEGEKPCEIPPFKSNTFQSDEHPRDQHTTHNSPNISADVWENLREIFADLDALNDSENKVLLKKPIMHLRRLLQIHSNLWLEELDLDKVHLGVLYEREWYLRKLQALEATLGPPPSYDNLTVEGAGQELSTSSTFSQTVRSILYEDNNDFKLIGSRWQ